MKSVQTRAVTVTCYHDSQNKKYVLSMYKIHNFAVNSYISGWKPQKVLTRYIPASSLYLVSWYIITIPKPGIYLVYAAWGNQRDKVFFWRKHLFVCCRRHICIKYINSIWQIFLGIHLVIPGLSLFWFWESNCIELKDKTTTTTQNQHVLISDKVGDITRTHEKHVLLSSCICMV